MKLMCPYEFDVTLCVTKVTNAAISLSRVGHPAIKPSASSVNKENDFITNG